MGSVLEPFTEHGNDQQVVGYLMWCPGCDIFHSVYTIPQGNRPRWIFTGTMDKPTFQPSLLVRYPYGDPQVNRVCHSFIRDGEWQFLSDCTHDLAGKTVPMVPIPD